LQAPEKGLEQRLAKLARMEKQLENRLSDSERSMDGPRMRSMDRDRGAPRTSIGMGRDFRNTNPSNGYGDRMMSRDEFATSYRPAYAGLGMDAINQIWDTSNPTTVQGGSLRTWSYLNPAVKRVHVLLKTDGRPLDADVELWQGPDNTPHKMKVYLEDGGKRTFSAFIDTPRSPNTIAIKNTGHLEFPLYACVGPDREVGDDCLAATNAGRPEVIQGGALRTYPFDPTVNSVAVLIKTDGRPLNARIELLQGPNNNKQVLELYTEDGLDRPFLAVIQTPGSGNVVRVVNSAPVEFPMYATVSAFELTSEEAYFMDGVQPAQVGGQW
jgi:hypothetical protein